MDKFNLSLMRFSATVCLILILALLLLGAGCATDDVRPPQAKVIHHDYYRNFDPDLHPMIQRYEAHLKQVGDLSASELASAKLVGQIKMYDKKGKLMTNVIGVCRTGYDARIEIEADYWWGAHRVQAEALGFHELAHCIQDRPHRSTLIGNCPSIMNPYIGPSATLIRCWAVSIKELFNPAPSMSLDNYEDECHVQPDGHMACAIQGEPDVDSLYDPSLLLN